MHRYQGILAGCLKRVSRWRVPPNWAHRDWMEEAKAHAALAACQALRDFEQDKGTTVEQFVNQRVMGSILTRYRQEWAYARRCRKPGDETPGPCTPNPADDNVLRTTVEELLQRLPKADRTLIHQVFFDSRSESEIAVGLGITQQAVSKRKGGILNQLRGSLKNV